MPTKAKCPHCGELVDHFERVGAEDAPERCPDCHEEIDTSTVEKIEVSEDAV